mmetsp:Transcript_6352/g.10667  ORF Transcript_6352/g.10667 Transcript_6352/m.10667 type:complete len:200 (-) Transcript_6352:241-840(-)
MNFIVSWRDWLESPTWKSSKWKSRKFTNPAALLWKSLLAFRAACCSGVSESLSSSSPSPGLSATENFSSAIIISPCTSFHASFTAWIPENRETFFSSSRFPAAAPSPVPDPVAPPVMPSILAVRRSIFTFASSIINAMRLKVLTACSSSSIFALCSSRSASMSLLVSSRICASCSSDTPPPPPLPLPLPLLAPPGGCTW